jgi:hypothetical protein
MSCDTCGDKGLVKLDWSDAPPDFGMCLCPAGLWYRRGTAQSGYGWQLWAATHGVEPSRVVRLEDVLTAAELAACGFGATQPAAVDHEAALLAAGKRKKGRL